MPRQTMTLWKKAVCSERVAGRRLNEPKEAARLRASLNTGTDNQKHAEAGTWPVTSRGVIYMG